MKPGYKGIFVLFILFILLCSAKLSLFLLPHKPPVLISKQAAA
ncbi:hypothetical protein [Shewanella sp. GXUN23E]